MVVHAVAVEQASWRSLASDRLFKGSVLNCWKCAYHEFGLDRRAEKPMHPNESFTLHPVRPPLAVEGTAASIH